jgi:pimeloyl-ACP methyl ester carboxylesterase
MRLTSDGMSNLPGTCGAQVGDILDAALGTNVYKPAIDFLKQIAPGRNYSFPWDWRTTPDSTLTRLDAYIDSVRNANSNAKVVLMAHSMGGLLARQYIDDPSRAAKLERLLTVGTPYWGSPKALFPLAAGIEAPGFSSLDLFTTNSELKAWAVNAFGLYFLYPSANYGPWLTVTASSPSPLDQAGVLTYIGNALGGNTSLLSQALNSHATTLDIFRTNGVKYRAVVGTGLNTVGRVTISDIPFLGVLKEVEILYVSGDSTVPTKSAAPTLGEPVPISYVCGIPHVDLPGDPTVTGAIKDFLVSGADIQGLTTRCPSSGFEIKLITLLPAAGPTAKDPSPAAASDSPAAGALSLDQARLRGLVSVFAFSRGPTIVTDASRPVSFTLPAGSFQLQVTPIQDGNKGTPATYGPLNGNVTIDAAAGLTVSLNGAAVQPGASDTVPPATAGTVSPAPTGGWNNANVVVTLNATDNAGGSDVRRITYSATGAQVIASTVRNGSSASFEVTASGVTTISFFAEDNAGNVETAKSLTVRIDRTAPAISCGAASAQWSAANVTIACTAADAGGSGLLNPADASFSLATTVPDGSETANALTGSRTVCDVAGNCATAGPIGGNKIDRKPPAINIIAPTAGVYLLNQSVTANFNCTDGGAGVSTCNGTLASGARLDTASTGAKTFTITATDAVGNTATQSVGHTVSYNVCLQYDPSVASPAGAANPIRIKLCDAGGADAGSNAITVTATGVSPTGTVQSPGNSNPGAVFNFLNAGGYQFLLDTSGYAPGLYALQFVATGDATRHEAPFRLK